jgi:hypothetical protein
MRTEGDEDDGDVWTPEQKARVQRGMEAMREPVKDADELLNTLISYAYNCGRYNSGGQPMPQDAAALVEARAAAKARMVYIPRSHPWRWRRRLWGCAAALAKLENK